MDLLAHIISASMCVTQLVGVHFSCHRDTHLCTALSHIYNNRISREIAYLDFTTVRVSAISYNATFLYHKSVSTCCRSVTECSFSFQGYVFYYL